jgi:hypothetical protein
MRLSIGEVLFIAIYFNAMNERQSFSLVSGGRRIFGYDQVKTWHKHPFESPDEHVSCDEPSLNLIFGELAEIIRRQNAEP